ncbi:MAG: hypothetical protein ACJAZ2_000365 [Glaciecola sp.]|jgi:hypothetical protein
MSAWGITNFENDVALDYVEELTAHKKQLSIVAFFDAFSGKFNPEETTLDECLEFFTIAEVLAAIQGSPAEDLPLQLKEWVELCYIQVEQEVAAQAIGLVELLLKDSEAKEMYCDTPYYKAWKDSQKDLIKRLKA